MLLRANVLAHGPLRRAPRDVELLAATCSTAACTRSPARRARVGASGDLAPLAHLALALIGEGEAERRRRGRAPAPRRCARAGLEPVELEAKEGLALVNGTQFMAAIGALALARRERGWRASPTWRRRMSLEALRGHAARLSTRASRRCGPIPGQVESRRATWRAARRRARSSSRIATAARVQDAYSLRCMPQVHGAVPRRDRLRPRRGRERAELGHRQPAGLRRRATRSLSRRQLPRRSRSRSRWTSLAIALAELADDQRAADRAAGQPDLSEGLPPFLDREPGAQLGVHDRARTRPPRWSPRTRCWPTRPASTRSRPVGGPGRPRLDGRRPQLCTLARVSQRRAGRWRSSCCAAPRGSTTRRRSSRGPRHRRAARRPARPLAASRRRPLHVRRDRIGRRRHP